MQQELLENLSFSGRSDIRYICVKGRTGDSARLERKYDAHKKIEVHPKHIYTSWKISHSFLAKSMSENGDNQ